jgi:purine-binding chemotaxis protein CheW
MRSPAADPSEHADPSAVMSLGGFRLGDMDLALPMASLREVVTLTALSPLPCVDACVVGGIDLRGVVVPVIDLHLYMGRTSKQVDYPCVVILVHEGHLLGLKADGVTGIFDVAATEVHELHGEGQRLSVLSASVQRPGGGMVSLLSTQALFSLRDVPKVMDPEPARQHVSDDNEAVNVTSGHLPLMLLQCGAVPLAVDAMVAYATLSDPQIKPSPLAMGHCKGVMAHAGLMIPAVDLQGLCGLGSMEPDRPCQAFIMSLPQGKVAMLVGEVLDVVSIQPDDPIKVPSFALPRAELFAGAVPCSSLPEEVARRAGGRPCAQFLMLDAQALSTCAEVVSLAQTNVPVEVLGGGASAFSANKASGIDKTSREQAAGQLRAMITYVLGSEAASPLAQISEILPYRADMAVFHSGGPLLGFVVHRKQSIPVLNLSALVGMGDAPLLGTASVLLVSSQDELIGFAVPQLRLIEPAQWEPRLPELGERVSTRQLALVGAGDDGRMVPVIDLEGLARRFQSQALAV